MIRSLLPGSALLALLVACRGAPAPAASPQPAVASAAARPEGVPHPVELDLSPPPADAGASRGVAGGGAPSSGPPAASSVDSQREPFLQGCMKRVPAPDYCECGYEQFRDLFKGADMSKETPDQDPRFAQLQQRTMSQCASKLPEDTVRAGFMTGCTGSEPRRAAYCQCAWPALRKTLSTVDFIGTFEGPRFDAAKKAMIATCKGKFPTDVARAEFMGACTKDSAAAAGKCGCVWTRLKVRYSTEEIAAGMADIATTPGVDKCQ